NMTNGTRQEPGRPDGTGRERRGREPSAGQQATAGGAATRKGRKKAGGEPRPWLKPGEAGAAPGRGPPAPPPPQLPHRGGGRSPAPPQCQHGGRRPSRNHSMPAGNWGGWRPYGWAATGGGRLWTLSAWATTLRQSATKSRCDRSFLASFVHQPQISKSAGPSP